MKILFQGLGQKWCEKDTGHRTDEYVYCVCVCVCVCGGGSFAI